MKLQRNGMDGDYNIQWLAMDDNCTRDNAIELSTSMSFVVMVCKKEKRIFFLLLRVFFLKIILLLLLPKLLQGLLTTWLQAQKHTRVHSLDANLKTHVKGKQMYVGLHHLVQIVYCNQTLCVCVYMFPRPKAASKTSFGIAYSFLPLKLRNLELHSL
jgi:formate/nitrite transporter FocA (FNT family)